MVILVYMSVSFVNLTGETMVNLLSTSSEPV